MLQALRDKTSGWIAAVILGLVIISFSFFGIQDYIYQRSDSFAAASNVSSGMFTR